MFILAAQALRDVTAEGHSVSGLQLHDVPLFRKAVFEIPRGMKLSERSLVHCNISPSDLLGLVYVNKFENLHFNSPDRETVISPKQSNYVTDAQLSAD